MNRFFGLACAFVATSAVSSAFALEGMTTSTFKGVAKPVYNATLPGSPLSVTNGFNIIISYNQTPTAAQAAAFTAAEARWESIITGYKINDIANTNVNISVNLAGIDGVGGTLGSAGPTTAKANAAQTAVTPTYLYTQTGDMTFDSADANNLIAAGSFSDVVLHEMGHVLGIGTLWSASAQGFSGRQELYVNNSGQYTGAAGLAAYKSEFVPSATFVPVELGGGAGTANGHWDEVDNGAGFTGRVSNITGLDMRNELMTGWLNSPTFISTLTVRSMEDLGYVVVPEPTALAVVGLAAVAMLRRSRKAR